MVFDRDWQLLEARFSRLLGPDRPGSSAVVRALVHKFCERLRAREAQGRDQLAAQGSTETTDEERENDNED